MDAVLKFITSITRDLAPWITIGLLFYNIHKGSQIHLLVNSQSEKLNAAIQKGAFAEGEASARAQLEQSKDPRNGSA